MDLHSFKLMRSPRAVGDDLRPVSVEGDLSGTLVDLLSKGNTNAIKAQARASATEWIDDNDDPLEWARDGSAPNNDERKCYRLCGDADRWLLGNSDMPGGKQFADWRRERLSDWTADQRRKVLAAGRSGLDNQIAAQLVLRDKLERLSVLTRYRLIVDVMDPDVLPYQELESKRPGDPVWRWLHRRPVVTAMQLSTAAQADAHQIELVRALRVSDLFVVKSEWSGYRAAEVANIMNVLAGESFSQKTKKTDEEETTVTESSERIESHEQSEEDRTQTEMSREIERAASISASAEASFNVSGQYGVTSFGASGSTAASASLAESSRTASKLSRDLVSKAVSKVESQVREERVKRRLLRIEDLLEHTIVNQSGDHMRGIFRWVDRIDRYQVFRFPDRLLLEVEIPEPAEYFRWRVGQRMSAEVTTVGPPPEFDVEVTSIKRDTYAEMALRFRASNLPAPPQEMLSVSGSAMAEAAQVAENAVKQWNTPSVQVKGDITIPAGYLAFRAVFSGTASPYFAKWEVEKIPKPPINNSAPIDGYHHILVTASALGKKQTVQSNNVTNDFTNFGVQIDTAVFEYERNSRKYGDSFVHLSESMVQVNVGVKDTLGYAVVAAGAKSPGGFRTRPLSN